MIPNSIPEQQTAPLHGTLLSSLGDPEGTTLGELQRCAENVLRCVMEIEKP